MENPVLVADIGGTNARFALYKPTTQTLSNIYHTEIKAEDTLLSLVQNYLAQAEQEHDRQQIKHACIAIACPVDGDRITMTNNHLTFSCLELKNQLNLKQLYVINDFIAVAMSVPALQQQDYVQIGGDSPHEGYPIAVYGAGTGLGVAHLLKINDHWLSLAGEGGHVDVAITSERQAQIVSILRQRFGRVSAERVLSGKGIINLYQAICDLEKSPEQFKTAKEIVENAQNQRCAICLEALTLFCSLLGCFGGNLAITLNTQGGVYLAGGIVPRFIDFLTTSPFRHAFEQKGRMSYLVQQIPVYIITHPYPGLLGAGQYWQNKQ